AAGLTIARLGRVLVSAGRVDEALELMRAGLAEAGEDMGGIARAELHGQLARALMLHDEHGPSIVAADRALEAAAPLDLVGVIADVLVTKGTALTDTAQVRQGVALLHGALELARAKGLVSTEFRAINNLVNGLLVDDPPAALLLLDGGRERARTLGHREWELALVRLGAVMRIDAGRWD